MADTTAIRVDADVDVCFAVDLLFFVPGLVLESANIVTTARLASSKTTSLRIAAEKGMLKVPYASAIFQETLTGGLISLERGD